MYLSVLCVHQPAVKSAGIDWLARNVFLGTGCPHFGRAGLKCSRAAEVNMFFQEKPGLRTTGKNMEGPDPTVDPPLLVWALKQASMAEGYGSGPCKVLVKDGKPVYEAKA
jgi:hypothetical protein